MLKSANVVEVLETFTEGQVKLLGGRAGAVSGTLAGKEDRLRAGAMLKSAHVVGGLEILTGRQDKLLGIEQGLCQVNRID